MRKLVRFLLWTAIVLGALPWPPSGTGDPGPAGAVADDGALDDAVREAVVAQHGVVGRRDEALDHRDSRPCGADPGTVTEHNDFADLEEFAPLQRVGS